MLVGMDPGKATGIAVWCDGALDTERTGVYTPDEVYQFLTTECGHIEHLQCEWFTISERTIKTDVDYNALHLIGAALYHSWLCSTPITFSNPGEVKHQFPDEALRQAGMWHSSDHVRDAVRHLCRYLVGARLVDPVLFLLTD